MKKLFVLGAVLTLFIASASAQRPVDRTRKERIENGFQRGQLTRPEKFNLQRDQYRHKIEKRRAFRDGKLTRKEKRRLHKNRRHDRHEMFRYKHNGRRRVL
jgi:hypothetical protein